MHFETPAHRTDSADADAEHAHQERGFLNRVRWFDSGRGIPHRRRTTAVLRAIDRRPRLSLNVTMTRY